MSPRPGRPPREAVTPVGTLPASRCRVCSAPGVLLAPGAKPSGATARLCDAAEDHGLVLLWARGRKRLCTTCWLAHASDTSDTEPMPGPRAALTAAPKRGGARPGAGRPRTLEPPPGTPTIRVRLDASSGSALQSLRRPGSGEASALIRGLLTAWGESAGVRKAVEAWRKGRGA